MKKSPTKAEIFINECSLQGQFETNAEFEKHVISLIVLMDKIIQKNNFNAELYKGNFFINFEAVKNQIFQKTFSELKQQTQVRFKSLLSKTARDWQKQAVHQATEQYVLVENLQHVTGTSIAEIAERKLQQSELAYLLINFSYSNFQTNHPTFSLCRLISVIKNQNPPKIDLDCLDNEEAFEQWVTDKLDKRNFLERNSARFQKTTYIVQGQAVYIEVKTACYWYLDNLHKDHFEVFNKQGQHLGYSNLQGVLVGAPENKIFKI